MPADAEHGRRKDRLNELKRKATIECGFLSVVVMADLRDAECGGSRWHFDATTPSTVSDKHLLTRIVTALVLLSDCPVESLISSVNNKQVLVSNTLLNQNLHDAARVMYDPIGQLGIYEEWGLYSDPS